MSSRLAELSNLEDLLYDKYGDPKHKSEVKWKTTTKHKDTYEDYEIPVNFEDWFRDFGGIEHPQKVDVNKQPVKIMKLTPYQIQFAGQRYGVMKKSNKVGLTTSEMLRSFHTRLLPETAGNDCLFTAASEELATILLGSIKYNVAQSPKYNQFMLRKSMQPESSEESNMSRMIIKNPYRHNAREGHILALGTSKSTTYSRMNVNRIHISDPSRMVIKDQDDYFAGVFSRVANTSGEIKIEGVPGPRSGWFFKLCQALFQEDTDSKEQDDQYSGNADQFAMATKDANPTIVDDYEFPPAMAKIFSASKVTIDHAVKYGLITAEMRQIYKDTMSPAMYKRTYMAEFPPDEDAVFRPADNIGTHVTGW